MEPKVASAACKAATMKPMGVLLFETWVWPETGEDIEPVNVLCMYHTYVRNKLPSAENSPDNGGVRYC